MFGSVVFDYQWCILIVMSVKSSFYNEYDIKNNEKPVFWAQRSFQNHHQTFHDRCPEKIGPLPKKSDRWSTRTCPENIRPAPTWLWPTKGTFTLCPCQNPFQYPLQFPCPSHRLHWIRIPVSFRLNFMSTTASPDVKVWFCIGTCKIRMETDVRISFSRSGDRSKRNGR